MKIIIGSKNPAKIDAVKQVFSMKDFEFITMNVSSGVSEQPFSDEETVNGAINRATQALVQGDGQIGIGLEGGVQETPFGLFLCNWGALVTSQAEAPIIAGGARILLPDTIAVELRNGAELGPTMDDFTKKQNIGKGKGAIGIFTAGVVNRAEMFSHVTSLLYGQYLYRVNGKSS
jgi:inosine/xanthosine triphosphatase